MICLNLQPCQAQKRPATPIHPFRLLITSNNHRNSLEKNFDSLIKSHHHSHSAHNISALSSSAKHLLLYQSLKSTVFPTQQLWIFPFFDNSTTIQYANLVGFTYRGEPMSNGDHRPILHKIFQRRLYKTFALRIQRARRFIQKQHFWILKKNWFQTYCQFLYQKINILLQVLALWITVAFDHLKNKISLTSKYIRNAVKKINRYSL